MPPDLGLGQMLQASDNPYCGELGMAQHGDGRQYMELDQSKGYHPSVQNVHWTLWLSSPSFMMTMCKTILFII